MDSNPLDSLLEKLCAGDADAAEKVFVAYEPYLRLVVRRMLPSHLQQKFDSLDVVHSVWADLWDGFRTAGWQFKDATQLRAFLVTITRNRFIDRASKHKYAARANESEAGAEKLNILHGHDPRPSESAQANDLWDRMLQLCHADHRQILTLKKQGLSLEDIATATGYHPSSIRRILYNLARRLGDKRDLPRGDDSPS